MSERHVLRVVLELVEVVAGPRRVGPLEESLPLHTRVAGQGRRIALTHVGEYEPQILLDRIARDPNPIGKGWLLERLVHALAAAVEHPTVIPAAQTVVLTVPVDSWVPDGRSGSRPGGICPSLLYRG